MDKKTKPKELDIHCACAIGDLSEIAQIKSLKKTETKNQKKNLIKDELKKDDSNSKK